MHVAMGWLTMFIDATSRFLCRHQYVALPAGERAQFACMACGHRAEMLPLRQSFGVRRVVPFAGPMLASPSAAISGAVAFAQAPRR